MTMPTSLSLPLITHCFKLPIPAEEMHPPHLYPVFQAFECSNKRMKPTPESNSGSIRLLEIPFADQADSLEYNTGNTHGKK
jgi:hypothetical protein